MAGRDGHSYRLVAAGGRGTADGTVRMLSADELCASAGGRVEASRGDADRDGRRPQVAVGGGGAGNTGSGAFGARWRWRSSDVSGAWQAIDVAVLAEPCAAAPLSPSSRRLPARLVRVRSRISSSQRGCQSQSNS
jgi:hypothetical protein